MSEQAAWEAPTSPWKVPLFSWAEGQLSVRYNRSWIRNAAERRGGVLSDDELEMFDFIDATAKVGALEIEMGPGDVYFANNYAVFHGRAAYVEAADWDERLKRLFLRLWLNISDVRRFSDEKIVRHGLIGHGNLGWTREELLAGLHLRPESRRSYVCRPSLRPAEQRLTPRAGRDRRPSAP